MARSDVPKFGNWEGEENVPYTAYFDKARKVRAPGSKIMNPNDPEENPDLQSQSQPPPHSRTKPEGGGGGGSSTEASNKRQGRTAATATATASAPVSLNNSYEKSPLHHSQAKDGHKNSYDGAARSKPKPNLRADENPKKVTVVPKFGDWDENNPASADGYTHIFNKVREERSSVANMKASSSSPSYSNGHKPQNSSCCCFGFRGN